MPMWPHSEVDAATRALKAHEARFGEAKAVCSAPATWSLIGEHTDHSGGVVLMALADIRCAVAVTPRADRGFVVREIYREEPSGELVERESTCEAVAPNAEEATARSTAERIAGLVHTMMHRQMLSRETAGFDVTVVNDIPAGAGLGATVALDVAAALAFASHLEDLTSAPVKTKLAEVCFQSSQAFSPAPEVRARYTAALRGHSDAMNVIDYSDGSITQATNPVGPAAGTVALVVVPPRGTARVEEVARRNGFIDQAAHAFGAENLQLLPDASTRVIDWLRAVHDVLGPEGVPLVEEASLWLQFMDKETADAKAVTAAIRSRRLGELYPVLARSQSHLADLLQLTDVDFTVAQLCLARGALSARSAEAGTSTAVIALVDGFRAENFAADLSGDGFTVIELVDGQPAC